MDILLEAARTGNVGELHRLLGVNPVILHFVALEPGENPLHLACLFGHLDFAKEMLLLKPEFAKKLSPNGYSPLHMAAANGRVEIVEELISFDVELCRVKGRDMMTPLHCAAQAGEVSVINEILSVCPECIEDVAIRGETALHLATKSSQYESLEILLDWIRKMGKEEIANVHDDQDNTIVSIALQMNQPRALQLLSTVNVETRDNSNGCEHTALSSQHSARKDYSDYFKFQKGRDSPDEARTALLVIAVLVVTATYQVGLSPPGGTWQDNNMTSNNTSASSTPIAGTSILGTYYEVSFIIMIGLNSIGLSVSLSMIAILTSNFPLRGELIACFAALYTTYGIAVSGITPYRLRSVSTVFTSVLPTLVPLVIHLERKYLEPIMAPMRQSLMKSKVFRVLVKYCG